jgi:hypothetical protein
VAAALLGALGACSGSGTPSQPTAEPTVTVVSTPPPPQLVRHHFLGAHFLAPPGWHAVAQRRRASDGDLTLTAPGNRGRIYVEVNDCIACIDQGSVTRAVRNELPDPGAVIEQYSPVTRHHVDRQTIAFTTQAPAAYAAPAQLSVTSLRGALTGYVVIEATLPYPAAARRIVASLHGRGIHP